MDSPVQIPFKSFVQLNADDPTAIYLQIVFGFIKAIQLGQLPKGTKLPGTRVLCKLLAVNRNTLIKAFGDLESQGFIEILPNKGTFILSNQKQALPKPAYSGTAGNANTPQTGFTFRHSSILESPIENSDLPLQFNDGWPDQRLIDHGAVARLYVSKLKSHNRKLQLGYVETEVQLALKKQVSNYLNLTRGLRISALQLIHTSNHATSLFLVMKLLIVPGDLVVVASPGYYSANMTITDSGADIISIPVDEEGIDTTYLRKICEDQKVRVVYLNSVYHYPTTVSLSAKRRIEILELSSLYGFVIVEDDYDFDFHFDNNPILPLATMDAAARVVYIGSFDRSLPAGFGCGFVSGPATFISELEKHQRILEPQLDAIKMLALIDWIKEGDVYRLLKKNKRLYKIRRDHLAALLNGKLGKYIDFTVPSRGLALWLQWIDGVNLIKLRNKCAEQGLFLPKTILYQSRNITATRLGFGSMNALELAQSVDILARAFEDLQDQK
ncbi:PLP-dependent aminotransferase family protein [Pedobacter sp. BMA]|uniref:aminotransferase-like domain-containing protein n=1 Tax=Pedobacter sp. BMA TaxID=1663685 RepID=UPI000649F4FD|nr:PLP-dependent aminotransferase family protein [Pedobacter sp. BMA]KLT65672.1 GntR family transcriptional regulator [Pedobacter sp. BMA]